MSATDSSTSNSVPPTHQDFHWIHGSGQQERCAGFIELTRDVTAGVHACLQIIYSSDLVREINEDATLLQVSAPALGQTDCAALLRLSLAATVMLRNCADEQIVLLNDA